MMVPLWRRYCAENECLCKVNDGKSVRRHRKDRAARLLMTVAVMLLLLPSSSGGKVERPVLFIFVPVATGSAVLVSAVALMSSAVIAFLLGKPALEGRITQLAEENLAWMFAGARVDVKQSCLKVNFGELVLSLHGIVVHHVGEFQSEYLMRVGLCTVIVDLKMLLASRGKEIKVCSIVLDDFEIVFEQSGRSNSMMSLMEKMSEDQPMQEDVEKQVQGSTTEGSAPAESDAEAFPVVWVEKMALTNLLIRVVAGSVKEMPVRIPNIEIPDFMNKTGEVCTASVKRAAMQSLLKRVCDSCHRHLTSGGHPGAKMAEMVARRIGTAKKAVGSVQKGTRAIGSAMKDVAKKEMHHVGDKVHHVGGVFKNVAHAARERLGSS